MKNIIKIWWNPTRANLRLAKVPLVVIALAALIGFSMTACEGPTGPAGPAGLQGVAGSSGNHGTHGLNSYLVIFNYNYDTPFIDAAGVLHGNPVTRPANPAKSGKVFGGWYTDKTFTCGWDFNETVTANVTLYAEWLDLPVVPAGLEGTWDVYPGGNPWGDMQIIITATTYTDIGIIGYGGDIVNIRVDGNNGLITIRFTEVGGETDHYDVGRYYVIHFDNFVATSVDISGAYLDDEDFVWGSRIGGIASQSAAETAYTVAAGAFGMHDTFTKQP
jgi:uncharacterized repeat protein (TIGR02543 family)